METPLSLLATNLGPTPYASKFLRMRTTSK